MPLEHLVVHHSATSRQTTVEQIRHFHVESRGWRDIGYHWLLLQPEDNGPVSIQQGRPEDGDAEWEPWEYGAHVAGHNSVSMGICCVGNYEIEPCPARLSIALADLLAVLCRRFGLDSDAIKAHREMPGAATLCPGDRFPLEQVRAMVRLKMV